MARIPLEKSDKTWMVYFRWEGRKCEFSTDMEDEERARAKAQDVEEFRKLVLRKSLPIPENVVDVPRWIATGGPRGVQAERHARRDRERLTILSPDTWKPAKSG